MSGEKKEKRYYIRAEEMRQEYDKCVADGKCSDRLLHMFKLIAEGFTANFMYLNTSDKKNCINYAVSEAWLKWNTYDPERTENIFSFYTTMISNDLRQHFKLLTRHNARNISIESLLNAVKK